MASRSRADRTWRRATHMTRAPAKLAVLASASAFLLAGGVVAGDAPKRPADLSPARWPDEVRDKYVRLGRTYGADRALAVVGSAMIAGTTGPAAIHAGLETLRRGGSAADAAVAAACAQIVLSGGSW